MGVAEIRRHSPLLNGFVGAQVRRIACFLTPYTFFFPNTYAALEYLYSEHGAVRHGLGPAVDYLVYTTSFILPDLNASKS